jgi:hypothetical protein
MVMRQNTSRQVKQLPLLTLNGSSKTTATMQLLVKITWGIDDLTPTMHYPYYAV